MAASIRSVSYIDDSARGNGKWSAAYLQRAPDRIEGHVWLWVFLECEPALDGIACATISEDFAPFSKFRYYSRRNAIVP